MRIYYVKITQILLIFGLIFNISTKATAQEEFDLSKYRMRFTFSTSKDVDNKRFLEVSFKATNKKNRKDRIPVAEALIKFYNEVNDSLLYIGETKTNNAGQAILEVSSSLDLLQDEEGYYIFIAQFDGTASLKKQKKNLKVKDLFLDLDLSEVDSLKMISVHAYTLDSSGSKIDLEELDLVFSVGGMLSKMPIEEASLEDGTYEFELTQEIQGDINGDFELFAFVDDHDDFGTVLTKTQSNWGVFDDIQEPEKNKLWTEAAPIWMYVVLTILLVGAWANYLFAILRLFKIKKIGQNIA